MCGATGGGAAGGGPGSGGSAGGDGAARGRSGGGESPREAATDGGATGGTRTLTRRRVLSAATGVAGLSTTATRSAAAGSAGSSASLQVRVYPGPVALYARLADGPGAPFSGWMRAHRDAAAAVEEALAQLSASVEERTSLDSFDASVEAGEPIGGRRIPFSTPLTAFTDAARILDSFRQTVHDRDLVSGTRCHLLLWWDPLNYGVGYGGTRPGTGHVAEADDEGAFTVANVGATEIWDDRSVTRNMAIHEVLHTLLSPDVVEEVVASTCDHDLGSAVESESGVREVSPMATSYAGPAEANGENGGGTRWHGTGCYDHDSFARHDGVGDVAEWTYTTRLSEATLDAVTRYVGRHLAE